MKSRLSDFPSNASEPTPPSLPRTDSRAPGWALWVGILAMVALVALVAVFAPKDDSLDQGLWIGLWFGSAALLAVGEMLTAGFFLLPFSVGAAAAGVLALAGVGIALQIVTFVVDLQYGWVAHSILGAAFSKALKAQASTVRILEVQSQKTCMDVVVLGKDICNRYCRSPVIH